VLHKYRKNNSELIFFLYLCTGCPWLSDIQLSYNPHFCTSKILTPKPSFVRQIRTYVHSWKHFQLSLTGTVKQSLESYFVLTKCQKGQSQWLHGLRCGPAIACLLRLQVWMPAGAWVCVSCECCVLSGRVSVMSLSIIQTPTEGGIV